MYIGGEQYKLTINELEVLQQISHSQPSVKYARTTGCAKKSNPLGKILYLRSCSRYIYQICRFYTWGFRPHILRLLLKLLIRFNRYNSLNFKVHFFKWTCSRILNIQQVLLNKESNFAQLFRQHFKCFSNKCQLPSRYLNFSVQVSASSCNTKSKSLSKSQGCLISELLWQIIPYWSKAVFSSAVLVGFGTYSVPVLHLTW